MIKLRFKEYPSGTWQDWSDYLITPPALSMKVESSKPGQAGATAFDKASVVLRYEQGNPVYTAFSKDLTSVQRYIFEVSIPDSTGTQQKRFEGVADFLSKGQPDLTNEISFDIIDKLSVLGVLEVKDARVYSEYLDPAPTTNAVEYSFLQGPGVTYMSIRPKASDGSYNALSTSEALWPINRGMVWQHPTLNTRHLILSAKIIYLGAGENKLECVIFPAVSDAKTATVYSPDVQIKKWGKEFYGVDIGNYSMSTTYYGAEATLTLTSFNAVAVIQALVKQQWPEMVFTRKPTDLAFAFSYESFEQTLFNEPFGADPLSALKMMVNSMECYILIDRDGYFVIQKKTSLGTNGVTRSLGSTLKISGNKKYAWDKIVDGVSVTVKSWKQVDGKFLQGKASLGKTRPGSSSPVKPKNELKIEVLAPINVAATQTALDSYAHDIATSYLDFYGKRHTAIPLKLNLDDNVLSWNLLDNININGVMYFFSQIEYDLVDRTAEIELVSVDGAEYYPGQMVIAYGEASSASGSSSYSSSAPSTGGGSSDLSFTYPLSGISGSISLLYNEVNLKVDPASHKLDTIQPISLASTPQFAKLGLGMACTANYLLESAGSGHFAGDVVVDGDFVVNGDTVVLNAYELDVKDKNIVLGYSEDISDITASGGGFTLLGSTDKSFIWNNNGYGWTSSEGINLAAGKSFRIAGTEVLKSDTLGAGVVNSSLQKVGTLNTGVWQASPIDRSYIAAGTANHVIINGADGKLSSMATLNVGRGGTGLATLNANTIYKGNGTGALQPTCMIDDGTQVTLGTAQGNKNFSVYGNEFVYGNMTVTGSLTLYELILQRLSYDNGTRVFSDGAKLNFVDPETHYCTCEDYVPFQSGDIIRAQKYSGGTSGTVLYSNTLIVNTVTPAAKRFTYILDSGSAPEVGQDYVRIGHISDPNRQGSVVITSSLSNAPYIDIKDGVDTAAKFDPSGTAIATIKARFGKISGITDPDFANIGGADANGKLPGHGVYMNGSAFIKGTIVANAGFIGGKDGWSITAGKISSGGVRMESTTNFKGLAVASGNYDVLKVGQFTFTDDSAFTLGYDNTLNQGGAWTFNQRKEATSVLPWTFSTTSIGWNDKYYWGTNPDTPIGYSIYKTLDSSLIGTSFYVDFSLQARKPAAGPYTITKPDSVFIYLEYTQGGQTQRSCGRRLNPIEVDYGVPSSAGTQYYIDMYIPTGAISPKVILYVTHTIKSGSTIYLENMLFQNFAIRRWNKPYVQMNDQGVKIFKSPTHNIKLTTDESVFNVPTVTVGRQLIFGDSNAWSVEVTTDPTRPVGMEQGLTFKCNGTVAKTLYSDGTFI